jgi:NAD(P)H-flavin reductase
LCYGIGITEALLVAESELIGGVSVTMLWITRERSDFIFEDRVMKLSEHYNGVADRPTFKVKGAVTREECEDETILKGRPTASMIRAVFGEATEPENAPAAVLCVGTKHMQKSGYALMKSCGYVSKLLRMGIKSPFSCGGIGGQASPMKLRDEEGQEGGDNSINEV